MLLSNQNYRDQGRREPQTVNQIPRGEPREPEVFQDPAQ